MVWSDARRLEHAGLASVVMLLLGAACTSVPDESQPLPDSYETDNSALWWFLALLAFGVAALVAATRLRNSFALRSTDGRQQWSWAAAVAAIVLALLAPLVLWGAADLMFALSLSNSSFDSSGLVLQVVPAVLVSAAAVRCARAGLREVRGQPTGRALALSATVLAYVVAGLMLAATLVSCAALMGQGG
jgi:hypothetical protein